MRIIFLNLKKSKPNYLRASKWSNKPKNSSMSTCKSWTRSWWNKSSHMSQSLSTTRRSYLTLRIDSRKVKAGEHRFCSSTKRKELSGSWRKIIFNCRKMIWCKSVKDCSIRKSLWWKRMKDWNMTRSKVAGQLTSWEEVHMQQQFHWAHWKADKPQRTRKVQCQLIQSSVRFKISQPVRLSAETCHWPKGLTHRLAR